MQRTMTFVSKIVILITYFTMLNSAVCQDWQLEKTKDAVQVYSRDSSNQQNNTAYKEILAITTVKASPSALLNLLNDIERAPQWVDSCIKVVLLSDHDDKYKLVQSTFSAPWPLNNRDMLTKSITTIQDQQIIIDIMDAGKTLPLQKNTVRMTDIQGQWTIKPIDESNIEIRYQGSGNPAGNIPMWLANKVLIDSTFNTFIKLSSLVTEDRYQHAQITH
jgi:ribosome-associated toxin RatA of RatAB toxin-antitoxin module